MSNHSNFSISHYLDLFTERRSFLSILFIITLCSCATPPEKFSVAVAGDWGDYWGTPYSKHNLPLTQDSLSQASNDDLIVLLGNLSEGKGSAKGRVNQAQYWCDTANKVAKNTPMIFVPGEQDGILGDVATYTSCLTKPNDYISKPKTADYGLYPYLYYVDIEGQGTTLRIVASSIDYKLADSDPQLAKKYSKGYEKNQPNYNWLKKTYQEAKDNNYWIVHINHLPCIDMGKNRRYSKGCEDIVNLDIEAGVNILLTANSHNVWRTHLLRHTKHCPRVPLTNTASGANPACSNKNTSNVFKYGSGLVQAHAGAAGQLSANKNATPCNTRKDGEAAHYLAAGTCGVNSVTGFVRLNITEKELSASYILTGHKKTLKPYAFKIVK